MSAICRARQAQCLLSVARHGLSSQQVCTTTSMRNWRQSANRVDVFMPKSTGEVDVRLYADGKVFKFVQDEDTFINQTLCLIEKKLGRGKATLRSPAGTVAPGMVTSKYAWRSAGYLRLGSKQFPVQLLRPSPAVSLPDCAVEGVDVSPIIPGEADSEGGLTYCWHRYVDENNAVLVGTERRYTPVADDVGFRLRCEVIPPKEDKDGFQCRPAVAEIKKVLAQPKHLAFQSRFSEGPLQFCGIKSPQTRVVSYKILSEERLRSSIADGFSQCTKKALRSDFRQALLIHEVKSYNADVIGLQDVGKAFFNTYLSPHLGYAGYEGFFSKHDRHMPGLAMFYRQERFQLHERRVVHLASYLQQVKELEPIVQFLERNNAMDELRASPSVLQLAVLENFLTKQLYVVANTQLHNHQFRIAEVAILVQAIGSIVKAYGYQPVILCGNFNCLPSSEMCSYVDGTTWTNENGPFNIRGAVRLDLMGTSGIDSGHIPYTTFSGEQGLVHDYVFFSRQCFQLHDILRMPSQEELKKGGPLPSIGCLSDHLPVVVTLQERSQ